MPAGRRGRDGTFPEGTINRMVEDRLVELAEARKKFGAKGGKNDTEDNGKNDAGV